MLLLTFALTYTDVRINWTYKYFFINCENVPCIKTKKENI